MSPDPDSKPTPWAAFAYRDYRLLWVAMVVMVIMPVTVMTMRFMVHLSTWAVEGHVDQAPGVENGEKGGSNTKPESELRERHAFHASSKGRLDDRIAGREGDEIAASADGA